MLVEYELALSGECGVYGESRPRSSIATPKIIVELYDALMPLASARVSSGATSVRFRGPVTLNRTLLRLPGGSGYAMLRSSDVGPS